MHDDCVVALGLAVERARRYRPCGAVWVGSRPEPAEPPTDIHAWFNKMREDPDWAFEGAPRWRMN